VKAGADIVRMTIKREKTNPKMIELIRKQVFDLGFFFDICSPF
jgi:4-hydroxy-3-methylbut-2-en-1-yl diphosphate synthase IspG/GcpE